MIWVFYGALVLCAILSLNPENIGWKILFFVMAGVTVYLRVDGDPEAPYISIAVWFVLFIYFVKIIIWFVRWTTDRNIRKKDEVARAAKKAKKEKELQDALDDQKAREEQFFNSPLTRKIIEAISDGTGRLPEEITIYDDHVTGRTNGQMRTFDFATNRVPFFKPSCFIPTDTDYHLLFGSKVALGNAINRILHEQYEVHDDHRHDADHRYNDNHEWVPVTRYTSNHVLLRLKATNHW